jgi:hypothetical protein
MLYHEDGTFNNFLFRVLTANVFDAIMRQPGIRHSALLQTVCGQLAVSRVAFLRVLEHLVESLAVGKAWMGAAARPANPFHGGASSNSGGGGEDVLGEWCYHATFQHYRPFDTTWL